MSKRILITVAWILTLAASLLAVGGFNDGGEHLFVFFAVSTLAAIAIMLFNFYGSSCVAHGESVQNLGQQDELG